MIPFIYDCAIISRQAGYRIQTDPSPHPAPLGGERVSGRAGEGYFARLEFFALLYTVQISPQPGFFTAASRFSDSAVGGFGQSQPFERVPGAQDAEPPVLVA